MTKETKSPIYRMGSPDPVAFVSNCFPAGVDTTILLDDEVQGAVQAIEFNSGLFGDNNYSEPYLIGTLLYVLTCDNKTKEEDLQIAFGSLVGKYFNLKLEAALGTNKFTLFNRKIEITGYKSGISIDDIVMEYTYKFKVIFNE